MRKNTNTKSNGTIKVTISDTESIERVINKCSNVISFDDLCKLDEKSEESNK